MPAVSLCHDTSSDTCNSNSVQISVSFDHVNPAELEALLGAGGAGENQHRCQGHAAAARDPGRG